MRDLGRILLIAVPLAACAAHAQPPETAPTPSLSPARAGAEPVEDVLAQLAEPSPAEGARTVLDPASSRIAQGGLAFGRTEPGAKVFLGGEAVPVDRDGLFLLGFGRDAEPTALLRVVYADGSDDQVTLDVEERDFPEQAVTGVPPKTVDPSEEDMAKIRSDIEKKNMARQRSSSEALWAEGFDWPARGRISGVYGSKRIYNGTPGRTFHSGVDVASPRNEQYPDPAAFVGAPVRAPSAGRVTLAEPDMFFEGGLVLIDHGQNLETALLHMSRIDVEEGDLVEKGDLIGGIGSTGRATGPHLHWSLKWHGTLIDPQLLVGEMDASPIVPTR